MTYVERVSVVRMIWRNGLLDELVLKRWIYTVKIHTLHVARSGHSLAMMPDGMLHIWILGGKNDV